MLFSPFGSNYNCRQKYPKCRYCHIQSPLFVSCCFSRRTKSKNHPIVSLPISKDAYFPETDAALPDFVCFHPFLAYCFCQEINDNLGEISRSMKQSKIKVYLVPMNHPFRRLLPPTILLASIIILAIVGYALLEGWTALESIYMAIITIFTVGFQEIRPLSSAGKILTIVIIIGGVGTAFYAAVKAVEIIVEGEMTGYRRRRRMDKKIAEMKNHHIICGFGRVGHNVAQVFDASGTPYVVIDSKKETLDELEMKHVPSIIGDATSDDILLEAGIKSARGLIACSDSDVANVYVTLSARALKADLNIVARAGLKDTEKKLLMAGANRVISPYFISGVRMAALVTHPVASSFLDLITHAGQIDFSLFEIAIPENSPLVNKTLAEAAIRHISGALVLAIQKTDGSFDLHPRAASKIERNDVMVVMGTQDQFDKLEQMVAAG